MAIPTQPHPQEVRAAVRLADTQYGSVSPGRIASVDEQVWKATRIFEDHLAGQAASLFEDAGEARKSAREVVSDLQTQLQSPLGEGEQPNQKLAENYETLRARALAARSKLVRAIEDAEWLAQKSDDPFDALCKVWDKYPTLRPEIV